jgi:ring hydroxylating enzyme alpha subunit
VDGSPGLPRISTIAPEQDRRYFAITIKPQVFVNLVPDHVIFHRMYPLAVDRTIVECDWLYPPGGRHERTQMVVFWFRVNITSARFTNGFGPEQRPI